MSERCHRRAAYQPALDLSAAPTGIQRPNPTTAPGAALKPTFIRGHQRTGLNAGAPDDIDLIEMPFQDDGHPGPTDLAALSVGRRAEVRAINGRGAVRLRLLEMGFVPGVEVALIKRAPLGDPLEIRLRGYHVSLRRSEARLIAVADPGTARSREPSS